MKTLSVNTSEIWGANLNLDQWVHFYEVIKQGATTGDPVQIRVFGEQMGEGIFLSREGRMLPLEGIYVSMILPIVKSIEKELRVEIKAEIDSKSSTIILMSTPRAP